MGTNGYIVPDLIKQRNRDKASYLLGLRYVFGRVVFGRLVGGVGNDALALAKFFRRWLLLLLRCRHGGLSQLRHRGSVSMFGRTARCTKSRGRPGKSAWSSLHGKTLSPSVFDT